MIPSLLHPLFSNAIAVLMLIGTIMVGRLFLARYLKRDDFLLSLCLGMVLISQTAYIISLHPITFQMIYPIAWGLPVCGLIYFYQIRNQIAIRVPSADQYTLLPNLLAVCFILASMGPPTMADALDYHLGIPVILLRHQEWPAMSLWLHSSLGGIGEIFYTLGMVLRAENMGSILQATGLVSFSIYLSKNLDLYKAIYLRLFILSSPVLIFLVTGPKPQLFPEVMTAIALQLTVNNKKIDKKTLVLICILIMGAAQQKLSFVLTGGVIGCWAIWKALSHSRMAIIFGLISFIFFFVPRGLWNLQQLTEYSLIGFFTPLPEQFTDGLRGFRENQWWFPFNLFVPSSIGTITTVLGFQFFLVFLVKTSNSKFRETLLVTFIAASLTYLLGQSIARSFYEFILWTAVAFSFLTEKEFNFRFYNRFLAAQGVAVLVLGVYAVYTLTTGMLSAKWRMEIMHRDAYQYSAANWLNQVLPKDAVVLSGLRSVSLLHRDFVPMDWLYFDLDRTRYYKQIRKKIVNFIALRGKLSEDFLLYGCVGDQFAGPKSFITATRNPFNRGREYSVTVHRFHSDRLPGCIEKKNNDG